MTSASALQSELRSWTQTRLGYRALRRVPEAPAATQPRGCDLFWAERWSRIVGRLRLAASVVLVSAVVLENLPSERISFLPQNPNLLLAVSLSLYGAAHLWKARTLERALVVLWPRKKSLGDEDVRRVQALVEARGPTALSFEVVIVAAEAGFTDDATELAQTLGIRCYRRSGSTSEPSLDGVAHRHR